MSKPLSSSTPCGRLVEDDQERLNEKRLEKLLLQRLRSGDDETFSMDDVRVEMRKRSDLSRHELK